MADGYCEATCGICVACHPIKAVTMAPTVAPTMAPCKKPAECSDSCVDVPPPSNWKEPTCAEQLAEGKCPERFSMADGYCEATCGICVACHPIKAATKAPTVAPTMAPTVAPTSAPTLAPTKAPCKKPAECSASCVDVPPPSNWKE